MEYNFQDVDNWILFSVNDSFMAASFIIFFFKCQKMHIRFNMFKFNLLFYKHNMRHINCIAVCVLHIGLVCIVYTYT